MKKSMFIVILLFLAFSNAYGSDFNISLLSTTSIANEVNSSTNHPKMNNSDSIFNQLGDMFTKGKLPTKKSTYGWWSGRCYMSTDQKIPKNSLLASRSIKVGTNNGPAFPAKYAHQMLIGEALGKPADFYDDISNQKDSLKNYIEKPEERKVLAQKENGSLASRYELGNLKFSIRKYKDYFVGQLTALVDYDSGSAGSVYANCYYFKKVFSY
ncbi:MAG: hypothetical protein HAW60_02230 [Bdellovibrionales bacterium]|nr:hypothetical protein [Bdellovibrionales bacterium]